MCTRAGSPRRLVVYTEILWENTSMQTFETSHGLIRYNLTNDFMFHVVFEENNAALCKFLGALLHMKPEEIMSVEVKNPIDYGIFPNDKKVILDLKLLLNSNKLINIEMQVLNEKNWPERSLIYLCRCYDNVTKGQDFISVFAAQQISILNFDLDNIDPEFYSTHHLINDRTGNPFTGNFALSVLNLRQIDIATDEDKMWRIDRWAKLLKAQTWEELRMIAANDIEMTGIANTLYVKNQDEQAQMWAQAREDFLWRERCLIAEKDRLRSKLIANGIDPDE